MYKISVPLSLAALGLLPLAMAQQSGSGRLPPVTAVAPPASGGGFGGGWGGWQAPASTAEEGVMRGMSDIISAQGQYNLNTSAAAINMTAAQRNYIENRDLATNTYFQMRSENKQYRAAEQGPRPTMAQAVRYAQAGQPKRLSPSEVDTVSGAIAWPAPLQAADYAQSRQQVEALFAKRAQYQGLAYQDQLAVKQLIDTMIETLKGQINDLPPMDYTSSKAFLQSLAVEARSPVG
jgi:hypothetical protein